MGKYFTISELCRSSIAESRHIDNHPTPEAVDNMELLIELLDKIREQWGAPIKVNSGYRCPKLNEAVKGAKSSQHMSGQAADITVGSKDKNKKLFKLIEGMHQSGEIEYDQLIDEYNYSWIHISFRREGNRNRILHLK